MGVLSVEGVAVSSFCWWWIPPPHTHHPSTLPDVLPLKTHAHLNTVKISKSGENPCRL